MKKSIRSNHLKTVLQIVLLLTVVLFNFGSSGSGIVHAAAPSNDNWVSVTTIPSIPYSNTINVTDATVESGEPTVPTACDGNLLNIGTRTVWYKYKPSASGTLFMNTAGSNYDTYIAIWIGSALNTLSFVACDDDTNAGFTSQMSLNVTAGVTYYIQIARFNGTQGGALDNSPCPSSSICTLVFNMKNQTFADVPGSYWAFDNIERLYSAGITGGCSFNPLNYCPETQVTRAQMAIFLLKGIHGSSYAPPAVGGSTGFADVPTSYWAAAWIKELALEGITGGCGGANFCPDGLVTRAQMAIFLLKAKHGSAYTPPAVGSSTGFADVLTTYWAAAWIKQLATEGVTGGCGGGNYCPETVVTRAQMAVFLVKTFSIP